MRWVDFWEPQVFVSGNFDELKNDLIAFANMKAGTYQVALISRGKVVFKEKLVVK